MTPTVKTITEIACKVWELDNDAKRIAKDISRLEASIEQPQIFPVQTPPFEFGRRWTGSGLRLSQLERLCIKFELRCHWCRKICDRSDPSLIPRRDRLVNFVKGKNAFSNLVLSCAGCIWRRYPETAPKVSEPSSPRPYRPRPRRRIYPWTEREFIDRVVWLKTRGCCFYCKTPLSYRLPEIPMIKDHYIPLFQHGHDDHSNLVPACKHCDRLKGHALPWEFVNRFTGKPLVCFPKPIVRVLEQA